MSKNLQGVIEWSLACLAAILGSALVVLVIRLVAVHLLGLWTLDDGGVQPMTAFWIAIFYSVICVTLILSTTGQDKPAHRGLVGLASIVILTGIIASLITVLL